MSATDWQLILIKAAPGKRGEQGKAPRHLGKWRRVGWWERGGWGGLFSSSEDLPRLIRLPARLSSEWRYGLAPLQRFHNFGSAERSGLFHRKEKKNFKKIGNCRCRYNGIILICDATLSDDKYVPTFIPLSVFFALLPSVRILNMARIDFSPPASSN